MSNSKNFFTSKLNRNLKVCRIPTWFLKLKGKIDSRKGKGVCDEFISKLLKKEAFLETNEIIDAETALSNTRKAGASAVIKLSENKMFINNAPDIEKGTSPQSIRANRTNNSQLNSVRGTAKATLDELSQINETIICIDTILEERIEKLRNHALEKCHVYISGVRASKMPDYENISVEFSDKALEIYHSKHAELDDKIHSIVSKSMKEAIV